MPVEFKIARKGYEHVVLPPEEFQLIKDAKTFLVEMLAGEEKLNILLENFVEYEEDLLRITLHTTVFEDTSWSGFKDTIHRIDRRLLNVLSAAKLFLDQSRHMIAELFGGVSPEMTEFKSQTGAEYDAHLGYRAMEALRNHVQHRGLSVHHLSQESWWVEDGDEGRCRHSLRPSLSPQVLREAGKFKSSVLVELESIGELVDLRSLVRQYIAGLTRVQLLIRAITQQRTESAETRCTALMARFRKSDETKLPLIIGQRRDDRRVVEEVQVFPDLIDRRHYLIRRNGRAEHIDKHFVVAEPKDRISGDPRPPHRAS